MGQEVQTEKHQEERPAQSHTNKGLQLQLLPMVLSITEIRKTYFLAPKSGVDLYTGKYGNYYCYVVKQPYITKYET